MYNKSDVQDHSLSYSLMCKLIIHEKVSCALFYFSKSCKVVESNIIDEYRKLAKKELKCERLDNNESLVEVVNRVYKSIFGDKIL